MKPVVKSRRFYNKKQMETFETVFLEYPSNLRSISNFSSEVEH